MNAGPPAQVPRQPRGLERFSVRAWEAAGIVMGSVGCLAIASQIVSEARDGRPSSVSYIFIVGFLSMYCFWILYGLRFGRLAIWLPNAVALLLQMVLGAVVLLKR